MTGRNLGRLITALAPLLLLPARDDTCTMRIYDAAFSGDSQ